MHERVNIFYLSILFHNVATFGSNQILSSLWLQKIFYWPRKQPILNGDFWLSQILSWPERGNYIFVFGAEGQRYKQPFKLLRSIYTARYSILPNSRYLNEYQSIWAIYYICATEELRFHVTLDYNQILLHNLLLL